MASVRACSNTPSKTLTAPLRPLDFESELTTGITATSMIAMMAITTRSSKSVKPRFSEVTGQRSEDSD